MTKEEFEIYGKKCELAGEVVRIGFDAGSLLKACEDVQVKMEEYSLLHNKELLKKLEAAKATLTHWKPLSSMLTK